MKLHTSSLLLTDFGVLLPIEQRLFLAPNASKSWHATPLRGAPPPRGEFARVRLPSFGIDSFRAIAVGTWNDVPFLFARIVPPQKNETTTCTILPRRCPCFLVGHVHAKQWDVANESIVVIARWGAETSLPPKACLVQQAALGYDDWRD
eukprot:scaffold528_cov165-Amphora_coffeaeformis.AAC.13